MTLAQALRKVVRGPVLEHEPLAAHVSIRMGGPADVFFRPIDPDDLVAGLRALRAEGQGHVVLGGGANTLVSDLGLREPVIQLGPGFATESWPSERELELGASVPGVRAWRAARRRGLCGPEFLVGIPGTLGGQVAMNAGTRLGSVSDLLIAAELATPDGVGWVDAKALDLGYRRCRLPVGAVVVRARLGLLPGDVAKGDLRVARDLEERRARQPWSLPNLGSTFKNPPGDHAGRLLEACGLKGHRLGSVAFSELHANFLVNLGGGRAADAHALVELGRKRVFEAMGVELEPEIRRVGVF